MKNPLLIIGVSSLVGGLLFLLVVWIFPVGLPPITTREGLIGCEGYWFETKWICTFEEQAQGDLI